MSCHVNIIIHPQFILDKLSGAVERQLAPGSLSFSASHGAKHYTKAPHTVSPTFETLFRTIMSLCTRR